MRILTGDIGGTKTWLQLAEVQQGRMVCQHQRRYASAAYPHLLPMLQQFLAEAPAELTAAPIVACFAIAGPIQGQSAKVTNLPWQLDSQQLQTALGLAAVRFINDFAAIGYALAGLSEQDWVSLQTGQPIANAPQAVIGAGTGLGHCIVIGGSAHPQVLAAEAGHTPFAPVNDLQLELLLYLRRQRGQAWVSYEQVVSGPGLTTLYQFLTASGYGNPNPALQQAIAQTDPAAAIGEAALQQDPVALAAVDLLIEIYGQQAANLALTCLAQGGVYIAGGIAPKLLSRFQAGGFVRAFNANPTMGHLLQQIPVKLITHPQVGLVGAGWVAQQLTATPN